MQKISPVLWLAALLLLVSPTLSAAAGNEENDLDNVRAKVGYDLTPPETALISPTGAHLVVKQKARVVKNNGLSIVNIILPPDSSNLQLAVPGHEIIRWSSTPALLNSSSDLAGRRARIEKERTELNASLITVNSRLALWQAPPKEANAQELNQLQTAMQNEIPRLALVQAELERRLKLINEELTRMPQASGLGERVRVVLADDLPEGELVEVHYNYTHDSCGWDPIYIFNATPEAAQGNTIQVNLLAEVWQFTGMDWKDTKITLSTHGIGPREPSPLPDWVIDSQHVTPQPRPLARAAQPKVMAVMANDAAPTQAPVTVNTDSVFATWQLSARGLPQGRARMEITSSQWKAPLEWLARPSRDNSQVWLYATYQLPADEVWPAGQAEYNVDGQSVGNGAFQPRNGEATLYFGADPRVSVRTVINSRTRGESGFITASKNWTWAWTYTITNRHGKAIKVKVERPAPMIVDQGVTVTNNNKPEAQINNEEHMYYWLMDVPANGKATIDHGLTISSPTKLPLLPDIP